MMHEPLVSKAEATEGLLSRSIVEKKVLGEVCKRENLRVGEGVESEEERRSDLLLLSLTPMVQLNSQGTMRRVTPTPPVDVEKPQPCSHIGGHKYVGNLIFFSPDSAENISGQWYGYVTPDDEHAMIDQHNAKGEIIQNLSRPSYIYVYVGTVMGQMRLRLDGEEAEKWAEHKFPNGNGIVERGQVEKKGFVGGCCEGANRPVKKEGTVNRNWFTSMEKEELLLGAATVGAVVTIAVAYSIYGRSG
ncbi:unnamed protein product, partial [Thlaspi arvense]